MTTTAPTELARVRYLVDDVRAAVDFYTTHLGFAVDFDAAPAFAAIVRGPLQLLLAGPKSSAARPMPDGATPTPGSWNRIQLVVDDITAEVARPRAAGVRRELRVRTHPCLDGKAGRLATGKHDEQEGTKKETGAGERIHKSGLRTVRVQDSGAPLRSIQPRSGERPRL
jgi:catechol 2,3-dioxygenase-like lactoylglutathione lyase family enzyme